MRTTSRSWRRRLVAAVIAAPFALTLAAPIASAGPAAGGSKPWALSASALLGKDGSTDLALTTSANGALAVPQSLKHVLLKSFDAAAELRYAKNLRDVAAPGGSTTVVLNDVEAGQPLTVQVQAQTKESKSTQVLDATATVLKRPDLTIPSVDAATTARPGQPVTVSVVVAELNGDIASTGDVRVLEGDVELDAIDDLAVPAGGSQGAGLLVQLEEPGIHNLTAVVGDVAPGEWDTTNNSFAFTVEVVEPNEPMTYSAGYYRYEYEWNEDGEVRDAWSSEWRPSWEYRYHDEYESLWADLWSASIEAPDGTLDIDVIVDGGAAQTLHLTGVDTTYGWWSHHDPETNTYVSVSRDSWSGLYVHYNRSSGDYRYSYAWFDEYGNRYDYCYWYCYQSTYGVPLDATSSIDIQVAVPTAGGATFGGSLSIPVVTQYHDLWGDAGTWQEHWYDQRYRWWGHQVYRSGYTSGTTSWS